MNLSAGVLGGALLFWGWQSGLLMVGALLALAIEGRRWVGTRWTILPEHFGRISDLSAVLFLAMAVYAYATSDPSRAFLKLSIWQPVVFAPLVVAQAYSVEGRIHLSALFVFLRRSDHDWSKLSIDLAAGFFVLCLLAAGAANVRTPAFYAAVVTLTGAALWGRRPAGASGVAWAALFVSAAALGWAGQLGLNQLQAALERRAAEFVFGVSRPEADANRTTTALGHIGELQQSDDIVVRLTTEGAPPPLLRVAVYNRFAGLRWEARHSPMIAIGRYGPGWDLAPPRRGARRATLSTSMPGGTGLLPLPPGAFRIENLSAALVGRSRLGALRADDVPPVVVYDAHYTASRAADGAPDADDLFLPNWHGASFKKLAHELKLEPRKPSETIGRVRVFFGRGFAYSTYREARDPKADPLEEFVFKTRTGHCEHFATSTVLLLRAAGVPARYVTGFSVQEFSRLENAWVARGRHAHAWALAWTGKKWLEVDTTPAGWEDVEASGASAFRPMLDGLAWFSFRVSRWWWGPEGERGPLAWAAVALLFAFLVWRLLRGATAPAVAAKLKGRGAGPVRGADSEWYGVERTLAARGLGRQDWETNAAWVDRVTKAGGVDAALLRAAAALHARYRFDPEGLDAESRERLRKAALSLISQQAPSTSQGIAGSR
ncbi:MAG: transglutaminase domain-containing protein [Elusimicrobia bacterium]|nr:transglutaminase domain-containing protein [Elusimicrobiota bacterium]